MCFGVLSVLVYIMQMIKFEFDILVASDVTWYGFQSVHLESGSQQMTNIVFNIIL